MAGIEAPQWESEAFWGLAEHPVRGDVSPLCSALLPVPEGGQGSYSIASWTPWAS